MIIYKYNTDIPLLYNSRNLKINNPLTHVSDRVLTEVNEKPTYTHVTMYIYVQFIK